MPRLNVRNPNPKTPYNPRRAGDYYPTPPSLAMRAMSHLYYQNKPDLPRTILDIGAGDGVWGLAALLAISEYKYRTLPVVTGIEIDPEKQPHPAYETWITGDFRLIDTTDGFDVVVGNPPYSLAEEAIRFALSVSPKCVMLLPLSFLEGQKRAAGLWKQYPPSEVNILPRRPSFFRNGKTAGDAYALFYWDIHDMDRVFYGGWMDWEDTLDMNAEGWFVTRPGCQLDPAVKYFQERLLRLKGNEWSHPE